MPPLFVHRILWVGLLFPLVLQACSGSGADGSQLDLQDAAERTIEASSFRASVYENDRLVQRVTYDKDEGMSALLADGAEARQRGRQLYFRPARSTTWLTGTAPGTSSIVDFSVAALRAVQNKTRTSAFKATTKDGHVTSVVQFFDAPLALRRKTQFDKFGAKLPIAVPPTSQTRPIAPADCERPRGGPESLICAQVLLNRAAPPTTTSTP